MKTRILVINPGSTSTKIGIYDDENPLFVKSVQHSGEELSRYNEISDQYQMRKDRVLTELDNNLTSIDTIVARGVIAPCTIRGL